ncbi:MAG: NAD(P)-dependent oxidoreductase [Pseudomonadota bacterium]
MEIAYLGFGIMGIGMVRNLLNAGHTVRGWNRTHRELPDGVEGHENLSLKETISEAVEGADLVMLCVTGPDAQEAIYPDLVNAIGNDVLVIDLTTTDPRLTTILADAVRSNNGRYLDAPVFGSKNEAWNGILDIVIGGDEADFEEAKPILEIVSKTLHYMGSTPAGAQMKLVGNLLVAAQVHSVGEAMSLVRKAGLNADSVVGVLKEVDYSSGVVVGTAGASLAGDYSPSFYLKHMLKDARLIGKFARDMDVPVPGSSVVAEGFQAAVNRGLGDLNASGIHKMQFEMAGLDGANDNEA